MNNKSLDSLRAKTTFIRKKLGHTKLCKAENSMFSIHMIGPLDLD